MSYSSCLGRNDSVLKLQPDPPGLALVGTARSSSALGRAQGRRGRRPRRRRGFRADGFLRVHCDACGLDRVVPFSCKGRGFCPSRGGRRMPDTAAHLVERVLPEAPVRQWVLSLPFALRYCDALGARIFKRACCFSGSDVRARQDAGGWVAVRSQSRWGSTRRATSAQLAHWRTRTGGSPELLRQRRMVNTKQFSIPPNRRRSLPAPAGYNRCRTQGQVLDLGPMRWRSREGKVEPTWP